MNVAVTGTQWGDEGKGKVVDLIAGRFDVVVRFQGGHNAGHSVVIDGERFALHVLPSGIFQDNTINLIGNGVVVEPFALLKEIRGLRDRGVSVSPEKLKISDRAHLIMPYHGIIDRFRDSRSTERKIGTTGRGIGPAYEWKAARRGIRFCDIKHRDFLRQMIRCELDIIHRRYHDIDELEGWTEAEVYQRMAGALDELEPYVVDGVGLLAEARRTGRSILFEGAQAVLLDLDFGTYPYVTSSNSCVAGITAGTGSPPSAIERVIGICKAYTTRIGEGPFPTELSGPAADHIRDNGAEYGTTTGRPRRCGWLDLVALKYAGEINGFDSLALMKLDVLDGLSEIKVCTAYRLDGKQIDRFPASLVDLQNVEPVYETLPGWSSGVAGLLEYDALPENARRFVEFIEKKTGCGIGLVSVGPDRNHTIIRDPLFNHGGKL